ncbi:MAG: tRNA (guanosine(46)-N7)-methyltransferase TrmB [Legionellaceae bacterium]|nr:tRNA (guanosine(46)-N7)-methyltransferase TrmB [Legionellaceae bacterium]
MRRTIKSFVLRAGRMSPRQQRGFDEFLTKYSLPLEDEPWDLEAEFSRKADIVVEIGFGMGASLLQMAIENPDTNFIGIEVHVAGVGRLAADVHDSNIDNIRIVNFDAVQVLNKYIPDNSLSGVQIFFPDPWHKKKHNKRRLIQPEFIKLLVMKLKPNGFIHCATDWEDYAMHMHSVLSSEPLLKNLAPNQEFISRPNTRPVTKFEQRGEKLGHGVWDLKYLKL